MAAIPEVTDATFKAEVLDSKLPVLVDFWAAGCAPCRAMRPMLVESEKQVNAGSPVLKFVALDLDKNPEVAMRYGITALPTLMVFKRGRVTSFTIGATPYTTLQAFIKKAVDR